MKQGADWYKREPVAFLGGVQGMTAKEHAVYGVVVDLIYQHGGSVNDDPAWFAGWISDMGAAAVRKAITSLIERGKLAREGDQLTNDKAKTEAKTKQNLRETRAKVGRKGGVSSGVSRGSSNNNKDLTQAIASPREDKTREDIDVDDSAGLTFREKLLVAAGHDPSGLTANGQIVAGQVDMAAFEKARGDLSLSESDALAVVADVMQVKRDGPPSSLKYFIGAMQKFAGARDSPPVSAVVPMAANGTNFKRPMPNVQKIFEANPELDR